MTILAARQSLIGRRRFSTNKSPGNEANILKLLMKYLIRHVLGKYWSRSLFTRFWTSPSTSSVDLQWAELEQYSPNWDLLFSSSHSALSGPVRTSTEYQHFLASSVPGLFTAYRAFLRRTGTSHEPIIPSLVLFLSGAGAPPYLPGDSRISYYFLILALYFNPFTPDGTKSKIDKFPKSANWIKLKSKQHYYKIL